MTSDDSSSLDTPQASPMVVERWDAIPAANTSHRIAWERLAMESGNVFATPEFFELWWEHFGSGSPLILACRMSGDALASRSTSEGRAETDLDDPELVALWVLYRRRIGPLSVIRAMGHGCGDELSLICRPDTRMAAVEALSSFVDDEGPDGLMLLDLVRVDDLAEFDAGSWPRLDPTVLHSEPCPVLAGQDGGWESYLASSSRNFRQQVRRRERQLAEHHDLSFDLTQSVDALPHDLATMIGLHQRRFDSGQSNTFTEARRRFHEDWARKCLDQDRLRLWTLRLDGEAVAAWYGFRFGSVEAFFQSGRDPDRNQDSVGFVLLAHTIREALEDGMTDYRFLRGDEGYKNRFANGGYQVATVAVPMGPLGRLGTRLLALVLKRRRAPDTA